MKVRCLGRIFLAVLILIQPICGWTNFEHPKMHSWDFEFDDTEEDDKDNSEVGKSTKTSESWTENNLCKNLQCKPHQLCIVRDTTVALCVNRKKLRTKEFKSVVKPREEEVERNDDEWDDQDAGSDTCIPCPLVTSDFVCGSDNLTYSSVCRLEFRNCMHKTSVAVACKGFCPCKAIRSQDDHHKEKQMKERWGHYINKYQNTVNKQNKLSKQKQSGKGDKKETDENSIEHLVTCIHLSLVYQKVNSIN